MAKEILEKFKKQDVPEINPGDIIRVHLDTGDESAERSQIFEGIVISSPGGTGLDSTFTVRRVIDGVGVERTFPLHSGKIQKIEFVKGSQIRRAKLYYLRGLSGKDLRMKDKQIDKEVWDLIATEEEEIEEVTEEEAEEAMEEAVEEDQTEEGAPEEDIEAEDGEEEDEDDDENEENNEEQTAQDEESDDETKDKGQEES